MYDYVNFKTGCPKCGTTIAGFQTKDRVCDMLTFEPEDVENFYASCPACGTWVEFSRSLTPSGLRDEPLTEKQVLSLGFSKIVKERQ